MRGDAGHGGRIRDVEHSGTRPRAAFVLIAARGQRPRMTGRVGHREVVRAIRRFPNEGHQEVAGVGRNGHRE